MDWYTDAEQRDIDAAGRVAAAGLQALRARDERAKEWRQHHVPWDAVSAGRSPEYPTDEGDTL